MTKLEISSDLKLQIEFISKGYDINKIQDVLDYNVKGGKLTRYHILSHIASSSKESDKYLVGFIMEVFHASFLMSDDIVDNSTVRRNKPCFYFLRGMKTLRDSRFLISLIYQLIKINNLNITNVIQKCFYDTCLGQTIDTKNKIREEFTYDLYKRICELKTSSYTVYMPIACGYLLSNRQLPSYLEDFTNMIGLIYQIMDDYNNFFPEKTKKSSNDLGEYKLTYFTAKLNEENPLNKDLDVFYNKTSIPDFITEWIFSYFDKYNDHKQQLVKKSKDMILEEDKKDLMIVYDILKKYE